LLGFLCIVYLSHILQDCEGDDSNQTCSLSGAGAAAPGGKGPAVVPRVVVELPSLEKIALLLTRPGPAIERLVAEVNKHGFDGLVGGRPPAAVFAMACMWCC
jgi:hypothetical protein